MKINDILAQIDLGAMALPEFQRGYVWNRNQVRELITSLYRRFPVGSLLVWATHTDQAQVRGNDNLWPGTVELILDGQQRITSLYGIIRGKPPKFFQGNAQAFTDLYFNLNHPDLTDDLDAQPFKFYSPVEMKDYPHWINVTELMQEGVGSFIQRLALADSNQERLSFYINRLNMIENIKNIDLHIEKVTGEDKTIDVVVEIFNKVNSGGTKLSKGDLALAKICAEWPGARQEMQRCIADWEDVGYTFNFDWLLRNVTTITTGQASFSSLSEVSVDDFKQGLQKAEKLVNYLLNIIAGRLGLDHNRVLSGRYAFPVLTRYLHLRGDKFEDARERDRMLYWYLYSSLWGRFTGASDLNQDLRYINTEEIGTAIDGLIANLHRMRGDLTIRADDFVGNSLGARFYPMLYLLTRVSQARDWSNGLPLSAHLLGKQSSLNIHHIFPKAQLYKVDYTRGEVNAIANLCFLTQGANLKISDQRPEAYFPEIENLYPGALASQWVPMEPELWKLERYPDFLAARRELLAQAANNFLDNLLNGVAAPIDDIPTEPELTELRVSIPGGIASEEEDRIIEVCNTWVESQGLPRGEYSYELVNEKTGQPLALLDLAWPRGIQEGLTQPVALLLDESRETEEIVNRAGYLFFTSVESFRDYVEREILAIDVVV